MLILPYVNLCEFLFCQNLFVNRLTICNLVSMPLCGDKNKKKRKVSGLQLFHHAV